MSQPRRSGGVRRSGTDGSPQVAPAASTSTQSDSKRTAAAAAASTRRVLAAAVSKVEGDEMHDDTTHGDEASVTAASHRYWHTYTSLSTIDIEADCAAVAADATATAARREAQADEQRRLDEERARAIAAARAGMTPRVAYPDGAVAVDGAADTATSGSTDTIGKM
jgi:uncharacterized membrane protein YccC